MYATGVGLVLFGLDMEANDEVGEEPQPQQKDENNPFDDDIFKGVDTTTAPTPQPVAPEQPTQVEEKPKDKKVKIKPDPDTGRGFKKLSRYLTEFFTEGQDSNDEQ